jgi:glycerophosphoryl diester phosphodiesterase
MLAIAHRGASAYAPENTRAAFDLAIEMGSDMIETDVHVTRDGELVLIHDDLVDRTSNGQGPAADFALAELEALDFGTWFAPEFSPQRVVTLDAFWVEVLPRIPVCLEIKDPLATDPLLRFLHDHNSGNRVQVTSFSWSAIARASAELDVSAGFLCRLFNEDIIERCAARGLAQVCPPVGQLTIELVARAHQHGLIVRAWGVKHREDIDLLFATGADGATSNWPDWITDHPGYQRSSTT